MIIRPFSVSHIQKIAEGCRVRLPENFLITGVTSGQQAPYHGGHLNRGLSYASIKVYFNIYSLYATYNSKKMIVGLGM